MFSIKIRASKDRNKINTSITVLTLVYSESSV